MKGTTCPHESAILAQARNHVLPEEAREHLATCESCSIAVEVDRFLHADADRTPACEELPDATLVWWRSQQQARLYRTEKATLPIQLAERLGLALGALGLLIGLSMAWPTVRATLAGWLGSWVTSASRILPTTSSSLVPALTGSILLLIGFGLDSQWAER